MIGLDTTAIIDLFRGDENIKRVFARQTEPFAVTQLTYLELIFGIDIELKHHQEEKAYYDELFNSMLLLSLDTAACIKASELFWKLRKQGITLGKFDSTIAAIFLINGISKIITKNKKHFEAIPGIKVISY